MTTTPEPVKHSARLPRGKTFAVLGLIFLGLLLTVVFLHLGQIRSLLTLRKVDDRPLYVMRYYGDYGFGEFAKRGAESDKELEGFVMQRILTGRAPTRRTTEPFGCTVFAARTPDGQALVGRNFDHPYTPILVLYTAPPDGYASISLVDLAYMGYSRSNLPTSSLMGLVRTLATPYVPFDGLNEKGLSISLLAVPFAKSQDDPEKPTLNTTTAIRLVLDRAKTVKEAISLLQGYNMYFSAGVAVHYLIADRSGDAAVVEFLGGRLSVVRSGKPWHLVTNFILSDPRHPGDGQSRYARASQTLTGRAGVVTEDEAMGILKSVVIPGRTQWSGVYSLSQGSLSLSIGEDFSKVREFRLDEPR